MNLEQFKRLRKAHQYQKKAFYALLPPAMSDHMAVIENEIWAMLMEAIPKDAEAEETKGQKEQSVKRVTIE
ncbi:MAG: hypothetical protein PWP24_812 [Clostridiales bacterium]|nr:hypothetical protein [Clostridiales bacterium]